jgi:hypothetical protein
MKMFHKFMTSLSLQCFSLLTFPIITQTQVAAGAISEL